MTDEEMRAVKSGRIQDKLLDLEVESTQLEAAEGPENPMSSGSGPLDLSSPIDMGNLGGGSLGPPSGPPEQDTPPEAPLPSLDLGGLSEKNSLSVVDDNAPIRVSKNVEKILAEIDEKNEDNLTEESLTLAISLGGIK